jgi:hypothetical protein
MPPDRIYLFPSHLGDDEIRFVNATVAGVPARVI